MGPFETLLDIEQNCKASAVNIPRQVVMERDWYGIGFRASNINFVCTMQEVTEVLSWPLLTDIPGSHPWFKGVTNLRGHMLPVTDLQGFVTGTPHKESAQSRVLVVMLDGALYGFSLERVAGIERFFGEEIKSAENLKDLNGYYPYVRGAFEKNHKPWIVLSFHSVIKAKEFYHLISIKMEMA